MMKGKRGSTGGWFILASLVYFIVVFIILSFTPQSLRVNATSGTVNNTIPQFNQTADSDSAFRESTSVLGMFLDLASFNIDGIHPLLSLLAVYLPVTMLLVGIILVLRGGS